MSLRLGRLRDAAVLAGVVAGLCYLGIVSRPLDLLALIWPANAVLLGLMLRRPQFRAVLPWLGAVAGYLTADLTTGGEIWKTLLLTLGNVAGVAAGLLVYLRFPEAHRQQRAPTAALSLLVAITAAGIGSGLLGAIAAPILLNQSAIWGFGFWFATEFVNYLVVLPMVLVFPGTGQVAQQARRFLTGGIRRDDVYPLVALAASMVVAQLVGGPGSIAFPGPALLWCAVRYQLFWTTLLLAIVVNWQMYSAMSVIDIDPGRDEAIVTISIRLGLALMALTNLTVATVNAARLDLIVALRSALSRDHLTGALSRSEFMAEADRLVAERESGALIMADLDLFKRINDTYGHAAGDAALVSFADTVAGQIRPGDLFGRIGGEEFALLLADADISTATAVAERIRTVVASTTIELDDGRAISLTVSQGIAMAGQELRLDDLLKLADRRLYAAKAMGRNRVCAEDIVPAGTQNVSPVARQRPRAKAGTG